MAINTQTLSIGLASAAFVVNLQKTKLLEFFNVGPNNIHINYTTNGTVVPLADECMLIRPNERIRMLPVYNFTAIAEVATSSLQINAINY